MSLSGKLLRGLKWYNFRNLKGDYPIEINMDVNKMDEIEFYLDFVKKKDSKQVHKILEKVVIYDMNNKQVLMKSEEKKLFELSDSSPTTAKSKEKKDD